MDNILFSFAKQSANSAAHAVARVTGSMSDIAVWNVIAPAFLLPSLNQDLASQ